MRKTEAGVNLRFDCQNVSRENFVYSRVQSSICAHLSCEKATAVCGSERRETAALEVI